MNLPGHNLTNADNLKQVEMLYSEIMKRFGGDGSKLPLLDPIEDMEIEGKQITDFIEAKTKVDRELDKI